jgi:hypothetical protein
MSSILLYGGLSRHQIKRLIHNTNEATIYSQIKESLRAFFYRLAFALSSGIYFTNKSLAEHLVTCHLNDDIKCVVVKTKDNKGLSFECDIVDMLFNKVINQIHSKDTKEEIEAQFKQKKTFSEQLQEDIKNGNISYYQPPISNLDDGCLIEE